MHSVVQYREQEEKRAAKNLNQALSQQQSAENKLHELMRYKQEYLSEFHYRAERGMTASQLQHYKAFLSQIDDVIERQQEEVCRLQNDLSEKKKSWEKSHQRTHMTRQYKDKLKSQDLEKTRKQEEKRTQDDYMNTQFFKPS